MDVLPGMNAPLAELFVRPDWYESANCRGLDPQLFFPSRGESVSEPRRVCAACVVRVECLDFALQNSEKQGFWGGLSERQRRALRRERNSNNGRLKSSIRLTRTVGVKEKTSNPLGKHIRLAPETHDPRALSDAENDHARRSEAQRRAFKERTTTGRSA